MLELPWYVFALAAAFIVAVSAVIEKKTLAVEDPLHFSSATVVVGGVLSLPLLFFVSWTSLSFYEYAVLYVIASIGMLSFFLVARSMKVLEAGEVSALLAVTPAAVALGAYLLFREALTLSQIGAIGLIILGLLVLEAPHLYAFVRRTAQGKHLMYVMATFLAVLTYTASSLLDRVALTTFSVDAISFIALVQTMGMINFLILGLLLRRHGQVSLKALRTSPWKVLTVALLLLCSRILHAQAVSLAFVALASALKRTGAIFTIILSGTFLHETGIVRKLAAASLIVIGAILLVL